MADGDLSGRSVFGGDRAVDPEAHQLTPCEGEITELVTH